MHRLSRSIVALAALSALTVSTAAGQPSSEPLALLSRLSDGSEIELPQLDRAIPSPISVLGYDVGSRFSHWREIRSYFEALTAASPRVTTWSYGSTYEDRPLQLVAISSPENLVRLDEIRQRNLALALPSGGGAMADDDPLVAGPVIAWLGYGVHGNEASSAEAAMAVAYILAAGGEPWSDLLRDVVVLIDPLANPDGRERYVHFYESRRGRRVDSLAESAEHHESWPGGRQNHYLVDLNRDWAWASQIETKWRLSEYRRWEPHVVVDLHEMSTDATYFFPPSAAPLNERIDRRTVDWLERFGRSNAAAFDARGWIYYSGETFDLYYPGYGDSYPSLRGAVGMTYEVAGHSSSGLAVVRDDGTRLTLPDRIARHTTSSLATVRTAAENRHQLLTDFAANRRHPFTETARTYLWDAGEYESAWIARVLEGHGIVVERLAAENELRVRPVTEGAPSSRTFAAGSWVASTDQPLGSLLRVLMDLNGPMPEEFLAQQRERLDQNRPTRFFDITAWSLPLAGNVETWIMDGATVATAPRPAEDAKSSPQGAIGFLTPPSGLSGYRFAARLLDRGVHFRLALSPFTTGGVSYPAGTLFVPLRSGNGEGTEDLVRQAAEASEVPLDAVLTSFSEKGISLGSESMATVRPPRIGLVSGRGVSATSFGFLWHLLDRQVEAPHHLLAIESLSKIDLRGFDVLVLPDGSGYSESLGILGTEALAAWTRAGGLLVSIGDSVEWLQENELTEVVSWAPPEVDAIDDAEASIPLPGGRGSDPIERPLETPGAAVNTVISESHPLAVGVPRSPRVLIQGSTVLRPSGDPQKDLLTIDPEEPIAAGFAWPEARERMAGSLLVGTEDLGSGKVVVFLPAPCFRLFWRANTPLFLNAVLYGPSLRDRGVF